MSEGIVQLKEALVALAEVGGFVVSRSRDGLGVDDLGALITKFVMEPEFKAKIEAGVKGLDAIPAELGDISLEEALELIGLVVEAAKKFK